MFLFIMCIPSYLFFKLWQIVTKKSRSLTINLHNRDGPGLKNLGTLTVHAEETIASKNAVEIIFHCSHLDNKDIFSKSVRIFVTYILIKYN